MQLDQVKRTDIFLVILMLLSIGAFLWQQYGMNHRLVIDPVKNEPFLFDDNDYGGTSISRLSLDKGSIEFYCETKPTTLTFPFCSVNIPILPDGTLEAYDISRFNTIHLGLEFNSEMSDTVLVYLQNDEIGLDGNPIVRANMSILTPENEYKNYVIPLDEFFLPSWWVFDHLGRTTDFEPQFDNLQRIQISTGDNRLPRTISMTINSVELRGKWISKLELYSFITTVWAIYFLFMASYKVIHLSQSRKEAADKARKLADLNEALEQAANAKDMFLSNMSHEIRTPMNGIYGALQILTQRKQQPENQELIDKAITSTKGLLTIINDILDFSKIEAGKLKLESTPFNLKRTIESIVSDFYPITKEKGIALECNYPENMWESWEGDPVRIKQILLNLTSNAVKFTDEGKVAVLIETISQSEQSSEHTIVLKVTDTGIGMSKKAVARLFNRFEQADNTTTRKYGGTGLGMSITYSLVELMNGTVEVTSQPGKGTDFTVRIPLIKSDISALNRESNKDIQCPKIPGIKLLVAEDNKVNMLLMKKMLSESDATIYEAQNGREAIELTEQHQPDLIFMDIQMPVMDGKNACQALNKAGVKTPIIAFTANVLDHEVSEYTEIGFDDHLAKPVELKKLYSLLEKYFPSH